ncbi:MAG: hypothetical protein A2020_01795 [Lentisphaerae bacterium GWF2_45_14]|nr:MAG: hypothetical protein A2020_01795 [Lentisphaerae bacterium GWF2_45_14]
MIFKKDKNDEKPGSKVVQGFLFSLKILFAAGVIWWLISRNYRDFTKALENFNFFWIIPVAALYFLHMFIGAWRWNILLRVQGIRISLYEAFSLTMQAFFYSLVIPGGAIGGDLAKVALIAARSPEGKKFEGSFTVLMDRFVGMMGLFSIAIVVLCFSASIYMKLQGIMGLVVVSLVILCFTGLSAGIFMFFHSTLEKIKLIAFMISIADKFSKGLYSRLADAFERYKDCLGTVVFCIGISIIFIHFNIVLILYFIARGVGVSGVSALTYLNASTIGNTAGLLPITVSGVGVRDVVIETLLKAGGCLPGPAIAIPIIFSAVVILFNISGGFFFIFGGRRKSPQFGNNEKTS